MTKFDFETDPSKFPSVWEAEEKQFIQGKVGPAEIMLAIDLDGIINKHVFLALNQYGDEADISFHMQDGKLKAVWHFSDEVQSEPVFDLEEEIIKTLEMAEDGAQSVFARALRAIADRIEK